MIQAKRFQDFDYGSIMNQRVYGSEIPPEVSIDGIKDLGIPIVIFYGKQDTIVFAEDSLWLKN